MGSELTVIAFAINFNLTNGQVNEDVIEVNNLNQCIFEKLSISLINDCIYDKPLIFMSTQYSEKDYGKCLNNFKEQLGLKGKQDLYVLHDVLILLFPTEFNFTVSARKSMCACVVT